MLWLIGLAVVVTALVLILMKKSRDESRRVDARNRRRANASWENDRSRDMLANPKGNGGLHPVSGQPVSSVPVAQVSGPVPIERTERMSPGRVSSGTASTGTVTQAPKAKPRKPRATAQTTLEVVKRIGPATSKEIAAQLRDTTPAKVSSILVGLRRDGKVESATRRNVKVWSALS